MTASADTVSWAENTPATNKTAVANRVDTRSLCKSARSIAISPACRAFVKYRTTPHSLAGYRFLLITPEGYYRPCAHKPLEHRTQQELIDGFSESNRCKGCYVAIRSYCDKSYLTLVKEQVLSRFA